MDGETERLLTPDDFIFDVYGPRLFQVKDIVSLKNHQADPTYTEITLTNGKKSRIRKALAHIMPRLPGCFFLGRRGWIINLYHIRDMAAAGRRTVKVTLSDLSEVLISRNQLIALGRQRGL